MGHVEKFERNKANLDLKIYCKNMSNDLTFTYPAINAFKISLKNFNLPVDYYYYTVYKLRNQDWMGEKTDKVIILKWILHHIFFSEMFNSINFP